MSLRMTMMDSIDQGAVKAAVEHWIYYGNRDAVIELLNQPWSQTEMGKKIIAEIEQEVRREKREGERRHQLYEQDIDQRDPGGLRWAAK